jgi:hypothetical protein
MLEIRMTNLPLNPSKFNPMKSILIAILAASSLVAQAKPLKVFILSGQSNMVGMANIKTFPAIGMDPETAPMLKDLLDQDGKPLVLNDVYICRPGDGEGPKAPVEGFGKLQAGYGGGRGSNIGPEYAFGIYMHKMLNEPILIIKTARGGRDLFRQFRPPSAGPLPLSEQTIAQMKAKGEDVEAAQAKNLEEVGYQYRWMMAYIKNVLADPKRVYPDYDPEAGYEIAGFAWLQGYNDFVGGNYPNVGGLKDFSEYTRLLGCFVRDIRKELNAPKMPFVVGVFGMGGKNAEGNIVAFRKAQAATAELPEFKGNVINVFTENFWPEEIDVIMAKIHEKSKPEDKYEAKSAEILKELKAAREEMKTATGNTRWLQRKIWALEKDLKNSFLTPEEAKLLEVGTSDAWFHYWGSAKFHCRTGKAFAEALVGDKK